MDTLLTIHIDIPNYAYSLKEMNSESQIISHIILTRQYISNDTRFIIGPSSVFQLPRHLISVYYCFLTLPCIFIFMFKNTIYGSLSWIVTWLWKIQIQTMLFPLTQSKNRHFEVYFPVKNIKIGPILDKLRLFKV